MKNDSELLDLSKKLRERWETALSRLAEISTSPDISRAYDEAFWGAPRDWTVGDAGRDMLANLLFSPAAVEEVCGGECLEDRPAYLYADMVDGYLTIHRHQGIGGCLWEDSFVCFEQFSKDFLRMISKYENHAEGARWCAAGMVGEDDFESLFACLGQKASQRNRFPDLVGVSLHVDLSLAALRIAYALDNSAQPRLLVLPAWGLQAWLKQLDKPIFSRNVETTLKMLIDNKSTVFSDGDKLAAFLPAELKCEHFLRLLLNLIPNNSAIRLRITGWLASSAFRAVGEKIFSKRYAAVTYSPAYTTYTYER